MTREILESPLETMCALADRSKAAGLIVLPFPPSSLSGHAKGHWRAKYEVTRKHRNWARLATMDAKVKGIATEGDIRLHVRFVPPNLRGDRTNFANRMKPYLDGIAEALGVNDARFLPSYEFSAPEKPGRVEVTIHDLPTQADAERRSALGRKDAS